MKEQEEADITTARGYFSTELRSFSITMASVQTSTQFYVAWPVSMSTVEMKRTLNSPDKSVKWDIALYVKPDVTGGKYRLSVEATAFSTESPPKTKFVNASCKLDVSHCTDTCRNYGCSTSRHTSTSSKEGPLCNNFHFKVDNFVVNASCNSYNILNQTQYVMSLIVNVTLRHYEAAAEEHPLLAPLDPCVMPRLKAMLDSGLMSDVTFVVDGEEIKAHSLVLAAASDVFTAMFQHDTEDKRTGRVTVEDVHPSIFKEMLRCVYTDSAPEWVDDECAEDFLVGLLFLAEKYLLEALRGHCQRRVIATLTVDNVVPRLRALSVVSPSLVPLLADPFVRMHLPEILSSESWSALMKEDSALAASVMFNAMKQ